jgi:CheY-like chemotaxis protein
MPQQKRILLIDDDYDHLLVCNLILQREGYRVLTMAGCKEMDELTESVETFRPDLIFMEHDMRGICGTDLTRMLKSRPEYAGIPIIYFSGRQDIVELTKQTGANGYFKKPYEVDGLLAVTRRYMSAS